MEASFVTTTVDNTNTSTTQKIELQKKQDTTLPDQALIQLEYNDKLKAFTRDKNVLDSLIEISKITESNLLYIYLVDYLPIINQILGQESDLPKPDYFKSIQTFIKNNYDNIQVEANTSFQLDFKYNIKTEKPTEFSVNFNPDDINNVLSVTIKNFTYNGCSGDLTFSILKNFDSSKAVSIETNNSKIGFVDLTTLPLLMKIGITTTNRRDYEMEGNLIFKTSGVVNLAIKADINASVKIYLKVGNTVDENNLFTIDGLIRIGLTDNEQESLSFLQTQQTSSYDNVLTSFYIKDTDVYVLKQTDTYYRERTRPSRNSSWSEWTAYSISKTVKQYLKLTQAQIVNDMMYYIFDFSLNAGKTLEQIENFIKIGSNTDPLDFFKSLQLVNDSNEDYYQAYLNIVSMIKVYADIYYHHGNDIYQYLLSRIHVYTNFDIRIGSITIDLDVTNKTEVTDTYYSNMYSTDNYTCNFDAFMNEWETDPNLKNLEYRYSKDLNSYPYIYTTTLNN